MPRAEYILGLQGVELAEEDQLEDVELIEEIMALREQMEDASADQLSEIADRNRGMQATGSPKLTLTLFAEQMNEVCKMIEKYVGEQNWEEVKKATVRLKYLEGIHRAAKD